MKNIILTLGFLFLAHTYSFSQCSDAGVCKVGSHNISDKSSNNSYNSIIGFGYGYGNSGSPEKIDYNAMELFGNLSAGKNITISFNLPFLTQNRNAGLGDAVLTGSIIHNFQNKDKLEYTGGIKIASSKIGNNFSYLNGYGTNDLLAGVNYYGSFFSFGAAGQVPLNSFSDNGLEFKRGPDFLFKAGYFRTIEKIKVNLDILIIKRLKESEIKNNNLPNFVIPGSDFTQINIIAGTAFNIADNISMNVSAGIPLLKRDENSDGTKRAFSLRMDFGYLFRM